MNKCELCDEPSIVLVTVVENDSHTQKSYCEQHARSLRLMPEQDESILKESAASLRTLGDFVSRNGRMPTSEESRKLIPSGCLVDKPASGDVGAQLSFLEHLADFIEKNGRWPNADELPPDPF